MPPIKEELQRLENLSESMNSTAMNSFFMKNNLFKEWLESRNAVLADFEGMLPSERSFTVERSAAVTMITGILLADGMSPKDVFDPEKGREQKAKIAKEVLDKFTARDQNGKWIKDLKWAGDRFAKAEKGIVNAVLKLLREGDFNSETDVISEENKILYSLGCASYDVFQELNAGVRDEKGNTEPRLKGYVDDLDSLIDESSSLGKLFDLMQASRFAALKFSEYPDFSSIGKLAACRRNLGAVLAKFREPGATVLSVLGNENAIEYDAVASVWQGAEVGIRFDYLSSENVKDEFTMLLSSGLLSRKLGKSEKTRNVFEGQNHAKVLVPDISLVVGGKDIFASSEALESVSADDLRREFCLFYPYYVSELKWGISKDGHTPRLYHEGERGIAEIREPGYMDHKRVRQSEVFFNPADNKTKENFLRLARMAELDYVSEHADSQFKSLLASVARYVTAEGRQKQQDQLRKLKNKLKACILSNQTRVKALNAKGVLSSQDHQTLKHCTDRLKSLDAYSAQISQLTAGNLVVPDDVRERLKSEAVREPANTALGAAGFWTRDNGALFPHEPSPADIKQGLGVQDCFMMSALIRIAQKDPQSIKDMMKDNDDGTVTVRFFNKNKYTGIKEPVYVRVNKTVNKYMWSANAYASSALWVQMIQKAYVKYVNTYIAPKQETEAERKAMADGFNAINRGKTNEFMNAIGMEEYVNTERGLGLSSKIGYLYEMGRDGELRNHPPGYLPEEKEIYSFFENKVNKGGKVFTVGLPEGNTEYQKNRAEYALDHGIRVGHAYAVMKVFEKLVDGHMKKFVQLRDPYAGFRAGYDDDMKLTNDSDILNAQKNAGLDNMGCFDLELTDFLKIYDCFSGIPEADCREFEAMSRNWRRYDPDSDYYEDSDPLSADEKAKLAEEYQNESQRYMQMLDDLKLSMEDLDILAENRNMSPEAYLEHMTIENQKADAQIEELKAQASHDQEQPAASEHKAAAASAPEDKPLKTLGDVERLLESAEDKNVRIKPEKLVEAFRTLCGISANSIDPYTDYQSGELMSRVGNKINDALLSDKDFKTGFTKNDIDSARRVIAKQHKAVKLLQASTGEAKASSEKMIEQIELQSRLL